MKILIFGSEGFIGKKLKEFLSTKHEIIDADKNSKTGFRIDAIKEEEVDSLISSIKPEVVIDTIALSSSVLCEKNPLLAKEMNYLTAKNIAESCKKINAKMIFFSSSYVFDGKKGNYTELDKVSPTNEYAKTKILAEKEVLKLKNSLIIRPDLMYGVSNKKLRFGASVLDKEVEIGCPNQMKNPLFAEDVPKIISKLIESNQQGIFHLGGPEVMNMKDFMFSLAKLINKEDLIKVVDSSNWIVKSPLNSTLNISKLKTLGIELTTLNEAGKIIKNQLS